MARTLVKASDHGALMDAVYRSQRHIYDATRKYFLFGRDSLIARLKPDAGTTVLEVACGTGRNLALIDRRWPGCTLYGLDISAEMLKSAQAKLGNGARLACGDATSFDAEALFGRAQFDRVVISYALSMIPDWRGTLAQAFDVLAPGGSLHVVDFGDLGGLPLPLRAGLRSWLKSFHVTPRDKLADVTVSLATQRRMRFRTRRGPLGYFQTIVITRG